MGSLEELGLELRAGVHTGECELIDGDLAGIAVHIGARLVELAQAGEVVVSSTAKDLVAGSGISFADRAMHELRGVPESGICTPLSVQRCDRRRSSLHLHQDQSALALPEGLTTMTALRRSDG